MYEENSCLTDRGWQDLSEEFEVDPEPCVKCKKLIDYSPGMGLCEKCWNAKGLTDLTADQWASLLTFDPFDEVA